MSSAQISAQAILQEMDRGESEQALEDARRLTEQAPGDPAAWRALGYVQAGHKAFDDAVQTLLHAISLSAKDAVSWEQLGWVYRRSGDLAKAVSALQESVVIDDTRTRARMMLANSLADLGKVEEAIAEYQFVLARDPDHVRAHNNLANLLAAKGRMKPAADHYARAADLSDELTYRISAAYAARRIGDWGTAERLEHGLLECLRASQRPRDRIQPFPLLSMPAATAGDQLAACRQMALAYAGAAAVAHKPPSILAARPRLRIGYVSCDLHDHAMTHLIVEALELHDRQRFEIVGFDHSPDRPGEHRTRILKAFDRAVPIADLSDAQAARRIAAEDIAITIDLNGWTTGARPQIFALGPRP